MFSLLKIIHLTDSISTVSPQSLLEQLEQVGSALPQGVATQAGLTLPRALNGGQLMWRLQFNSEEDCWACVSSNAWRVAVLPVLAPDRGILVDTIAYRACFSRLAGRSDKGIWRCLVMAVDPAAPAQSVRQLQRDLMLMPEHITAIRDWALGQVTWSQGRRRWTHVWEQEFAAVTGLEADYMIHPIHWGVVDGWFDPECPQRIVDPFLVHAAFVIPGTVIGQR